MTDVIIDPSSSSNCTPPWTFCENRRHRTPDAGNDFHESAKMMILQMGRSPALPTEEAAKATRKQLNAEATREQNALSVIKCSGLSLRALDISDCPTFLRVLALSQLSAAPSVGATGGQRRVGTEIGTDELAHSLFGLADEYTIERCDDTKSSFDAKGCSKWVAVGVQAQMERPVPVRVILISRVKVGVQAWRSCGGRQLLALRCSLLPWWCLRVISGMMRLGLLLTVLCIIPAVGAHSMPIATTSLQIRNSKSRTWVRIVFIALLLSTTPPLTSGDRCCGTMLTVPNNANGPMVAFTVSDPELSTETMYCCASYCWNRNLADCGDSNFNGCQTGSRTTYVTAPTVASLTDTGDTSIATAVTAWVTNPTTATATYGPICAWDTSAVINMGQLFYNKPAFNADIVNWNVLRVADLSEAFHGASAFTANIGAWTVSAVTNMAGAFEGAAAFNANLAGRAHKYPIDIALVTESSLLYVAASCFPINPEFLSRRQRYVLGRMEHSVRRQHGTHIQRGWSFQLQSLVVECAGRDHFRFSLRLDDRACGVLQSGRVRLMGSDDASGLPDVDNFLHMRRVGGADKWEG
jgi:hypothetical protein